METSYNLKRRRDSGDSDKDGEKKQCTPKPKKQQPQIENKKPQQPMPIQPQKPTEKIQGPSPIIQNNPQRPAQILHSPAQHIKKEPTSTNSSFSLSNHHSQNVLPIQISKQNWTITITHTDKNSFSNKWSSKTINWNHPLFRTRPI